MYYLLGFRDGVYNNSNGAVGGCGEGTADWSSDDERGGWGRVGLERERSRGAEGGGRLPPEAGACISKLLHLISARTPRNKQKHDTRFFLEPTRAHSNLDVESRINN